MSMVPLVSDFDDAHRYDGISYSARLLIQPTILDWLQERAIGQASLPYITFVGEQADVTLSYGQLDRWSSNLAAWLRREIGSLRGSVAGLVAINDLPSVVAIYALMKAGAAILFLNPDDPIARIEQQTAALGVRCILGSPTLDGRTWMNTLPRPETLPDQNIHWPRPDPYADAFYFGTSGSTAASKLVAQSHYNAAVNAEAIRRHHGLGPGERILGCLPIHHVNGLHLTVFGSLAAGTHAIMLRRFSPFDYMACLARFCPRVASVVPSILEALLATARNVEAPKGFEYFISAAAPLSRRTAAAVAERLKTRVLQGYGLTETVNFSTTMPRGLSGEIYAKLMMEVDVPSIGVPLFGNDMAVLGPDLQPLGEGMIGEICMRGHNVMQGYARNAEATAEAFRGGWFHSQDLGFERHIDGRRYFVLTGRTKNIAKVGGGSVSLDEVDRVLKNLPGIVDAACVALADPLAGERIVAAVVLSDPIDDVTLRSGLALHFPISVLPSRFERMAVLPRTPTGKILRAKLAEQLSER